MIHFIVFSYKYKIEDPDKEVDFIEKILKVVKRNQYKPYSILRRPCYDKDSELCQECLEVSVNNN